MARFVALLWLVTTVLGAPCTDEGCDNGQDSHLLQVTGKAAALQLGGDKAWGNVHDAGMITDDCGIFYGLDDGPQGLLNDNGNLGIDLRNFFADQNDPDGKGIRASNGANTAWDDAENGCLKVKPFGDSNGNEVRCKVTTTQILKCVNGYFAFLTKHRDGLGATAKAAWGTIAGTCTRAFNGNWKPDNQIKTSAADDGTVDNNFADNMLKTLVASGPNTCGDALMNSPNGYFAFGAGTGWGDNIADAFELDTSVAGGDVTHTFSYPERTLAEFLAADHGLAQDDSWASMNPVFCGASSSGNIAHRCLQQGGSVGGEEVGLSGDEFQRVTFDDCKNQAKACQSCIHTAGTLESGMNGLPAQSGMWQQILPGNVGSPNAVGKCCFYSAPCDEAFWESPRHRQSVIKNGVQTTELARIGFNLIVH